MAGSLEGGFFGFVFDQGADPFGLVGDVSIDWTGLVPPVPTSTESARGQADLSRLGQSQPQRSSASAGSMRICADRLGWQEADAERRGCVLRAWERILAAQPEASVLGAQLAAAQDDAEAEDTLRYAFHQKATATAEKRLGSIQLYRKWAVAAGFGEVLPTDEKAIYAYVRALEAERAPATRAQSFIEAVRFLSGVAGLSINLQEALSSRVLGATMASADRKRLLLQSPALTVQALATMENFVLESQDEESVVVIGGFVFMVHCRFRYKDTVRLQQEPTLDVLDNKGYVQTVAVSEHIKSGQGKRRRRREVPVVGSAFGLLGRPWAQRWLQARAKFGLNAAQDGTLLPARSQSGWLRASADATEANAFLRSFLLEEKVAPEFASTVSTHSCKATLLSWCAKAGMRGEHRRLLGGHAKPKERSVLEYSRDALATPLDALCGILDQVRYGSFNPDADRSGRRGQFGPLSSQLGFRTAEDVGAARAAPPGAVASAAGLPEVAPQESDSASISEGSGSSEEHPPLAALLQSPPTVSVDVKESAQLFQHVRYPTVHRLKDGEPDAGRHPCGIPRSRTKPIEHKEELRGLLCIRCFGGSTDARR